MQQTRHFKIDYFRHFPINVRGKVLGSGTWPEGTEQGGYYLKTQTRVPPVSLGKPYGKTSRLFIGKEEGVKIFPVKMQR